MAEMNYEPYPMLGDGDAVLGVVRALTVVSDEGRYSIEVSGQVRSAYDVPQQFVAKVPIEPGWALVKLRDDGTLPDRVK